ncbi:MAG: tRNA (adenosine(37)-N6)-threonylcarbamoyltransferase complex transferase subunit TsaD [Anaerolineales bacterium]|uniref:tRNA (adenosine(37)-N6)-threonylcarbamoyltransferase complex transferase subunit TsaD n=1 Tax=Candidatus Villigracilis affinis TaxID=3140682 RepID=UPI001B40F7AB|nr:tRNA (adenosine(37)-N6)-threonylcarbamoyltransferase complex transferase subunit TsaD [Anaerolineales bacterium]MBK9604511.1 tRNA (adenosine(37)-N6)-threonylcarbamoyltransferase complex transferase subunit TsaD [Anaerolineales bacterium]MBL0343720.1 tRNA (adenosine(37)-N6)-threonylcarbamoyltransferase complex transferase subunit TsaD [Anaerolineales bacterium]MBP8047583.1 tRNA (adenosine(37)-N6)-threonylcarbamoyltransferase complex transferase subunit TsaD [Anaerolineales bacterium]
MELKPARILALETSCDETACAIIENGRALLSSVVASQMEIHARYGGVYPEVASRQHVLSVTPVVEQALAQAHLTLKDIDALAVTQGPGLAGSLVVGMNMAKGLALGSGLPLLGVNHLEGHLYSAWVYESGELVPPAPQFPLMALLVSGGHTELNLMTDHLTYQRLGSTLDDAAGEAFDKVARLLELGYPGGPAIQKSAEEGDPNRFHFPRAWLEGTWDFSFSGLKTAVLYEIRELQKKTHTLPVPDLAASFQKAVVDVLFKKTINAAREFGAKEILVAGGVSANRMLRQTFRAQTEFPVHIPPLSLCTDNAAMIASAGYHRYALGHVSQMDMDVMPTWPLP